MEKNRFVHRLTAQSFVPNPNSFKFIRHKDGDKTNNEAENLEWVETGGDENLFSHVNTQDLSAEQITNLGNPFEAINKRNDRSNFTPKKKKRPKR